MAQGRERLAVPGLFDDGNAFYIMGKVTQALRRAGRGDEAEEYRNDAKSGNYNHLLQVTMQWADEA